MIYARGYRLQISAAVLFFMLMGALPTHAGDHEPFSTTMNGGRGLVMIESARTYGTFGYSIGVQGLSFYRDYLIDRNGTVTEKSDLSTVVGVPVVFGLTNWLDVSAAVYGYPHGRPFIDYGDLHAYHKDWEYGMGASRVGLKFRAPFAMETPVQVAVRAAAVFGTSDKQLERLNYRWTRTEDDYEVSLLETFDLGSRASLHLEQGYVVSGSDIFDDQVVAGAGLEVRPHDAWRLGVEVHNRTFDGVSPESIYRALYYPTEYWDLPADMGKATAIRDTEMDYLQDYFTVTPSIACRLTERISLHAGAVINIADHKGPEEPAQFAFGITFTGGKTPADNDGDGVPDREDREMNTPAGYPVNANGVALDSDGDGVPDGRDRQLSTPRGAKVNLFGEGIDTDGDGIYDGIDREMDTPPGCPVDDYGVALDEDADGVPNCRDTEADTPAGVAVDENGVALKQPEPPAPPPQSELSGVVEEPSVEFPIIYFPYASTGITPEAYYPLKKAAEILLAYPDAEVAISGHTDSLGDPGNNERISRQRAEAVLAYLLKHYPSLDRERFTVEGYGSRKPISTNATPYGRSLNRRVEFSIAD